MIQGSKIDVNRYQQSLLLLSELNLTFKQSYKLLQQYTDVEQLCFGGAGGVRASKGGTGGINKTLPILSSKQQDHWRQLVRQLADGGLAKHALWLQNSAVQLIDWHNPMFPSQLKALEEGPGWLWVWGNGALLQDPGVAIVGGRYASSSGIALAGQFGRALASAGLTIISGLAVGVDGASHQAALDVGGDTIAVLGSGLGCMYPTQHTYFAQQIIQQGGCVVSPWPLFSAAKPYHFPARNRIVSGLSLGVLIVEATRKSGSLITARAALEQGKEVFALPASVHNKKAEGNLCLIQDGAMLVYEPEQIIAELAPQLVTYSMVTKEAVIESLPTNLQQLLNQFGYEPTSVDIICQRLGLLYGDIAEGLMELTLQGYLVEGPQGYERLK